MDQKPSLKRFLMDLCYYKLFLGGTLRFKKKCMLNKDFSKTLGIPKITLLGKKKCISETPDNRYFCNITVMKWSQIGKTNLSESVFSKIFV